MTGQGTKDVVYDAALVVDRWEDFSHKIMWEERWDKTGEGSPKGKTKFVL